MKSNKLLLKSVLFVSVLLGFLYFAFYLFVSLTYVEKSTAAPTFINGSVLARVNVTNYPPRVVNVTLDDITSSPPKEIDLVTGYYRTVFCNGTVVDWNGKDDITHVNATIFFTANKSSQSNDLNEHYSNYSCSMIREATYNKTFSCSFRVWFFANNGTWYCNMSAWDTAAGTKYTGYNSSRSTGTKINPLYALAVPPVVDFGEMSLNTMSNYDQLVNVTNTGNMRLDLNLYGYGGQNKQENNLSMLCSRGNITVKYLRFDINKSNDPWSSMTNLSGQFANPKYQKIGIRQRTSETKNVTNSTFWKIRIPQYQVKGQCNGTIVFDAIKG